LTAYAKNEFYLSKREKGFEATNREALTFLEKSTGQTAPELLTSRNRPKALYYIWEWFVQIYTGEPLTYREVLAWSTLTGSTLQAFEANLLIQLSRYSNV
jgi:hypothetical protein